MQSTSFKGLFREDEEQVDGCIPYFFKKEKKVLKCCLSTLFWLFSFLLKTYLTSTEEWNAELVPLSRLSCGFSSFKGDTDIKMESESSIPLANSFSHTFERFLGADDRGIFASFLTKDSLEIADGSSVFKVDPVGLFRLCLLLKHSSSNFNTVDFLSKDSTRLKQDLQIRQDCRLSTSIVWRINWEIFSARRSWVSKL